MVSPLILAGGVGVGLGSVKHGVALIFPFMVLRKFSGGYHAKNLHTSEVHPKEAAEQEEKHISKKKSKDSGQMSLFDMMQPKES